MYKLLDDLNNLEFRIFIYSCLKINQNEIASRLNIHILEINQTLKDIQNLRKYEGLKNDILEAFFSDETLKML